MILHAFSPSRRARVFESEVLDSNPGRIRDPGLESDSNPRSWIRIRIDSGILVANPMPAHGQKSKDFQ